MSYFKNFQDQAGATIIEALVALFVFAVGALGIAALQTTSMVRSDDVKQRSVAIWKAQELADRIKATKTVIDPNGLADEFIAEIGSDDISVIGDPSSSGGFSCPSTAPTSCAAGSCDIAELVEYDVWSVLCDPKNGVTSASLDGSTAEGTNFLKDFDIAFFKGTGTTAGVDPLFLYFEWKANSTEKNEDIQGNTVKTELCGTDKDVDSSLGVYCLRFL